jgi:peptide deformylase
MIPNPANFQIDYYDRHLEHKVCRPILPNEFNERDEVFAPTRLQQLVTSLGNFCREKDGYAISAPQVGIYIRLAVVVKQNDLIALVNPTITRLGGADLHEAEACLSLPPNTADAKVTRCSMVEVEYQDVHGRYCHRRFTDLMARIVQHETDHLDGCFFINRVGPVARDIVMRKYKKHMRDRQCQTLISL